MALRGTLKDFGIADIFQLIGHQTKSGLLTLKNRDSDCLGGNSRRRASRLMNSDALSSREVVNAV